MKYLNELPQNLNEVFSIDHLAVKDPVDQYGTLRVSVGSEGVQEDISLEKARSFHISPVAPAPGSNHKSSLVTSYSTEMVIKTIPHPPQSSHQVPSDVWMFLRQREKLVDCRFQDVHEMKEAVTKVLSTFTLEGFQRAFMRWLGATTSALNLQ